MRQHVVAQPGVPLQDWWVVVRSNTSGQGGSMIKQNLEKELRKWREARARKTGGRQTPADRRTLRVNGQEVVVITKPKRALA